MFIDLIFNAGKQHLAHYHRFSYSTKGRFGNEQCRTGTSHNLFYSEKAGLMAAFHFMDFSVFVRSRFSQKKTMSNSALRSKFRLVENQLMNNSAKAYTQLLDTITRIRFSFQHTKTSVILDSVFAIYDGLFEKVKESPPNTAACT